MKKFQILWLVVFLTGCSATSQLKQGKTGPEANEAVMGHIRLMENVNGRRDCETKVLKVVDRGTELRAFVEYWHVSSCGVETIYKIRKLPIGPNQYKYAVSYPSEAGMLRYRREQK